MTPERPPWLLRGDWLEACDERGECPDCGDPIPECLCDDIEPDTDDTMETNP